MKPRASVERLRQLLDYNPETGVLIWRERDRNLTGLRAGGIDPGHKYRRVRIDGRLELAHRVALAMVTGEWPEGEVDHINGERDDNRLSNLRIVSRGGNLKNKRRYRVNRSGVAGVYWHGQHQKWCASICSDGKRRHLGLFRTVAEAAKARAAAEAEMGFHKNHGRD